MRVLLLAFVLSAVAARSQPVAQDRPLPEFDAFVAQVKTRLQTDGELQRGYVYTERRVEQELDGSGRVTDEHVQVFEVHPALPGEDPYRRLLEEDGRPVPAKDLAKRDRERREEVQEYARRLERQSDRDRRKAVEEYEKAVKERGDAIDDIFNVFDVRIVGRDHLEGHQTIVFSLTPKANARPRTDSGRMMRHFKARAWISEAEFELVRVDVEAVDTVSFGLGLLARLHEGSTLSFQRRKVNGEAWLPARVAYTGSGRVLLVRHLRRGGRSEFSTYRKYTVETSTELSLPVEP
jgi:hypothetical protein